MKNAQTTDWNAMLTTKSHQNALVKFAFNGKDADKTGQIMSKTKASTSAMPAFKQLVESNGELYARRLARKALRYRGLTE